MFACLPIGVELTARPTLVCVVALMGLVEAVHRSNREIKRLANNALSPVVSNMGEVQHGVSFIRFTQTEVHPLSAADYPGSSGSHASSTRLLPANDA